MKILFLLVGGVVVFGLLFVFATRAFADPVAVGAPAPDAEAIDQDGNPLKLSAIYAKGPTLVYFYPKAGTPGCTTEACNLRDSFVDLQKAGLTVVGVSTDRPDSQKAFKEKQQLPFTLLADPDKKVINAFGVPTMAGFAARQSFLIKGGKVVWRDLKATPSRQAQDALAALKGQ